jgi:3-deoxy-7-phosphoheptulonate synthase
MLIIMSPRATPVDVAAVVSCAQGRGCRARLLKREERTVIRVASDGPTPEASAFESLKGIERIAASAPAYELASRASHPESTTIQVDGLTVGGNRLAVMAGPCAVEDRALLLEIACAIKEAGVHILRGGAFKPRTSPYSFQGLGHEGLELLAEARAATGLAIVTEVVAPEDVPLVASFADIVQIGARNMQNYALLNAAGACDKPVLLKRGMMCTLEELLMSAEYILSHGNSRVILCERGIRTFETYTRNTLDVSAVPLLKQLTHLPVIVDPSHSTGKRELVAPVSRAAVAAGADGLLVEVHSHPQQALSDGPQSLLPEQFACLMNEIRRVANAVGRDV